MDNPNPNMYQTTNVVYKPPTKRKAMSADRLLDLTDELEELTDEVLKLKILLDVTTKGRDEWKKKALKAEARVKELEKVEACHDALVETMSYEWCREQGCEKEPGE